LVLRVLFAPAIVAMNRLSYAHKFVLISVLLSGPLAALAWLLYSTTSEQVHFNARERVGVSYIEPARDLLSAVQRHRVASCALLSGNSSFAGAESQAATDADTALTSLERAEELYGLELGTADRFAEVRGQWVKLRREHFAGAEDSDRQHALLASNIADVITHQVGNSSNLILDPDLDSYWLMDAFVIKLPALSETIAETCTAWLRTPGSAQAQTERTIALAAGLRASLRSTSELAAVDLRTATDEAMRQGRGPALKAQLDTPMEALSETVTAQANSVERDLPESLASGRDPERDVQIVAQTLNALERVGSLSQAIAPELDKLVAARKVRYERRRTFGVLAATAVAALLMYFFIGFYLSVRSSLLALANSSDGPESEFIPPAADELGQIARAYSRAQGEKNLLQRQLAQADRLATVGLLAAGTAHELNEPLGAILGFSQLVLKSADISEQARQDLTKIEKAALHAREVIRKLLLFARQTPPKKTAVALNPIVEDSLDLLSLRIVKHGVTIERDLECELPAIAADPAHVRQVVVNLVVNAIQASHTGDSVLVRTRSGKDGVVLVVQDLGVGMTESELKDIFLPFYTTKEVGQGTGLGLSVVHGIVTAHGGTINVESSVGHGTRLEVFWPIRERASAEVPTVVSV